MPATALAEKPIAAAAPVQLFQISDKRRALAVARRALSDAETELERAQAKRDGLLDSAALDPAQKVSHLNAAASADQEIAGFDSLVNFRKQQVAACERVLAPYEHEPRKSQATAARAVAAKHRAEALEAITELAHKLAAARAATAAVFEKVNAMRAAVGMSPVATGALAGETGELLRGLVWHMAARAMAGFASQPAACGVSPPPGVNMTDYAAAVVDYLRPGWLDEWE